MVDRLPGHAYFVAAIIAFGALALLVTEIASIFVG
jgi:hypothetical protein